MKTTAERAMLRWLRITLIFAAADERVIRGALLRTAQYRTATPGHGLASLEDARCWRSEFMNWYNRHHRHTGIRFASQAQGHAGEDGDFQARRHALTCAPVRPLIGPLMSRRVRRTISWQPVAAVTLSPENESIVNAARPRIDQTGSVAQEWAATKPTCADSGLAATANAATARPTRKRP